MQNNSYRETFAFSQSMIKDFHYKTPRQWKEIHIDNKKDSAKNENTYTFGSLVDIILFTPEELDRRFYIGSQVLPSNAIVSIMENAYNKANTYGEVLEDLPEDFVQDFDMSKYAQKLFITAADEYINDEGKRGWNLKWKPETRYEKLLKEGNEYFQTLVKSNGRKIISMNMNFDAIEIKDVLLKDEDVKDYFVPSENNELRFQFEIFTDYELKDGKKIPVKGALDILRINHKDKTIQIVDFKTTESAFNFIKSIKQFGYATQLSYYDFLLRLWLQQNCKDEIFCNYQMLPPINIAIDKYEKVPYIYEYDWQDLAIEREGNAKFLFDLFQTNSHNSKIKRGWQEILEEVAWHYHNNYWEKPKKLYENKKIKLNLLTS